MSNSNGKITAPVSMTDIAQVLGTTSDMAKSDNINVMSKNKPFVTNGNAHALQTEADRKDAAYGFYWWNKVHEVLAPCSDSKEGIMDKALQYAGKWNYKKATVSRMGDFIGYNHNAVAPYDYIVTSPDFGRNNYLRAYIDPGDTNREMKLSLMPPFEADSVGLPSTFRVAAVYRRRNVSNAITYASYSDYTVQDMDDNEDNVQSFNVNLANLVGDTVLGDVTFDVVFVATNAADISDGQDEMWIYLPNTLTAMTYSLESGIIIRYTYNDPNVQGFVLLDYTNSTIRNNTTEVFKMALDLEWEGNAGYDLEYIYDLHLWRDGDSVGEWSTITGSGELEDLNPVEIPIVANVNDMVSGYPSQIRVGLDVRYRKLGATTAGYTYKHFDFLLDALVNGQVTESGDNPTLYEIMTERINNSVYPD